MFQSNICRKMWSNRLCLASGPERDGNASVGKHVMTKQDYKKVEFVKVWFLGSTVSIRKRRYTFVYFFIIPRKKFLLYLLFPGPLWSCRSFYDGILKTAKFSFFSLPHSFWCYFRWKPCLQKVLIFLNFSAMMFLWYCTSTW